MQKLIAASTIHGAVLMTLKAAILLDIARTFSPRGQRNLFFWTCHLLLWVNVVFYSICMFLELFGCQPREKFWNKLLPGGYCINIHAVTVASGAVNVLSDLVILVLPQKAIWRLHLSWRKKVGISAIFAVAILLVLISFSLSNFIRLTCGFSACLSAVIRLVNSVPLLYNPDVIYSAAQFGVWVEAEIAAGFLILGFPTIPKIIKSSPKLQKLFSVLTSWAESSASKMKTESRKGLQSWYKSSSHRKAPREPGWSDLELTQDHSVVMKSLSSVVENRDGENENNLFRNDTTTKQTQS